MIPVRTNRSNVIYKAAPGSVGVEDGWGETRSPVEHHMQWEPTPAEREAIANGALIDLGIMSQGSIPPVSVSLSDAHALTERAAALRDRAQAHIRLAYPRGWATVPPGRWLAGSAIREELATSGALDPDDDTLYGDMLYGRPVVAADPSAAPDLLVYAPLSMKADA